MNGYEGKYRSVRNANKQKDFNKTKGGGAYFVQSRPSLRENGVKNISGMFCLTI